MDNKYIFSEWSVDRKIRALELMDEYLKKNTSRSIYETQWAEKYGVKPKVFPEKAKEIAENENLFVNTLFGFYICLTTDLSWLKI